MRSVLSSVMHPGIGFALSGITLGSDTAFLTIHFATRHWSNGWFALTAFSGALIVARLVARHLPDRFGGARVAFAYPVVQAAGLGLIAFAPIGSVAIMGAAVTGRGLYARAPELRHRGGRPRAAAEPRADNGRL